MAEAAKNRQMRFPYTLTAQIRQFPYKYYMQKSWFFKYWFAAAIIAAPVFWKIQKKSYSEENQKIWYEKRREMFEGGHH